MKKAVILAALVVSASPSFAGPSAEFLTVDLRKYCEANELVSRQFCHFYLLGFVEGAAVSEEMTKYGGMCAPDNVEAEELRLVFNRLMEADIAAFPSDLKLPAGGITAAVLQRAYPCKK